MLKAIAAPHSRRVEEPLHQHAQAPEDRQPDQHRAAQARRLEQRLRAGEKERRHQRDQQDDEDGVGLEDLPVEQRHPRQLLAPVEPAGHEQVHDDEQRHQHADDAQVEHERGVGCHVSLLSTKIRTNGVIENSRWTSKR